MKFRHLMLALLAVMLTATAATAKKKKETRGMLESMQSVPCGVKEHGLTGLGTIWGSVGATHVNSDEKLCAQYVFRTDDMDYHIRPADMKHAVILPVGHEGEYKIKGNRMYLKIPDGDKKTRAYQVISMEPPKAKGEMENTAYTPARRPSEYRQSEPPVNRQTATPPPTDYRQSEAPPVNRPATDPPPSSSPPE